MRFEKWQALGNDYIVIERDELPFELTPLRIMSLCAPHTGVFGDGVLLLSKPEDPRLVVRLEIFNPDGSRAELSGNGARQAILYLRRRGWTDQDEFSIATDAGEIRPQIVDPMTCRVDMGYASTSSKDFPGGAADGLGELQAGGRTWPFQHVSIGNPQCAIYIDDLELFGALRLDSIGPEKVWAADFGPIEAMISVSVEVVLFGSPTKPIRETIAIKAGKRASSP